MSDANPPDTDLPEANPLASNTYERFTDSMKDMMDRLKLIYKLTDHKLELPKKSKDYYEMKNPEELRRMRRKAQHTFFGGAYMNLFLLWEGFVQDFLEETFRRLIDLIIEHDHPPEKATEMLKNAYESKVTEMSKNACEPKTKPKSKEKESAIDLAVELSKDPKKWKEILCDYQEKCVNTCRPFFDISDCKNESNPTQNDISGYFKKLFLCGNLLTHLVSEEHQIYFHCIIDKKKFVKGKTYPLIIDNANALANTTKLLYGFRCMLSHSNGNKTFRPGGALYKFPEEKDFSELMSNSAPEAVEEFYFLYTKAEEVKEKKTLCYIWWCGVVNLYRFIVVMMHRLHNAVVKLIIEEFGLEVWKEQPDLPYSFVTVPGQADQKKSSDQGDEEKISDQDDEEESSEKEL